MDKEFALLELKSAKVGDGLIEGYGAVTGNVDSYGDVIAQGAFDGLDEFVKRGGILVGHDWGSLPVAMIESAKEDERGLWFKARFHSDEVAQRARAVVQERLEAGKFVGLSIGFRALDYSFEERDGREVRVLTKVKVYEISIVLTPANPLAGATGAKTMEDDYRAALAAVDRATKRLGGVKALREAAGRKLSEENLGRVRELLAQTESLTADLKALLPAPEAAADDAHAACGLRLAQDRARALGLEV